MEQKDVSTNLKLSEQNEKEQNDEMCCCTKHYVASGAVDENYQPNRSNLNSDQIDEETITKLRGDAIGDTMYSESFVIKILLQFSDLQWSEKVEEDLCFLWDMTLEKDICDFLFKLSFPSLACSAILRYDEQRFVEIVIGILANICSFESTPVLEDDEIDVVLNFIDTDDHLILIQVMRFVKAVSFKNKKLRFITRDVLEKIKFILNNSMNKELLLVTLDVMSKITLDYKLDENFLNRLIVSSSLNAYQMIIKIENKNSDLEECDNRLSDCSALTYLVHIILNLCTYINVSSNDRLLSEVNSHSNKLVHEFSQIFRYFAHKDNLIPLDDDLKFYIDAFTIIFPILNVNYHSSMYLNLFKMIHILTESDEDISNFIELIQYFSSVAKTSQLKEDMSRYNGEQLCVLNLVLKHTTDCEHNCKDIIVALIKECKSGK